MPILFEGVQGVWVLQVCTLGQEGEDHYGSSFILLIMEIQVLLCIWDGWETLFDDFWVEVPRLLRRWGTLRLGAQSFLLISC